MGGDHAPAAILTGCLDAVALLAPTDQLVLVGDENVIRQGLASRGMAMDPRIEIEPTTEVIGMDEEPVRALREKQNSSIVRWAHLGSRKKSG